MLDWTALFDQIRFAPIININMIDQNKFNVQQMYFFTLSRIKICFGQNTTIWSEGVMSALSATPHELHILFFIPKVREKFHLLLIIERGK